VLFLSRRRRAGVVISTILAHREVFRQITRLCFHSFVDEKIMYRMRFALQP